MKIKIFREAPSKSERCCETCQGEYYRRTVHLNWLGWLLLMGYTKLLTLVGGVNINMQHGAFNRKIRVYDDYSLR